MTLVDIILNVFSFSLAFSLVGLGVFLSSKIFRIIDLTCESSFALGGCVYGAMVLSGANPLMAMLVAMVLGYFSGVITSAFINYIKLDAIVASLLTVGGIQSLLLKLVSIERLSQLTAGSLLGNLGSLDNLFITVLLVGSISFAFYKLMISEFGLAMRVYGNGPIITETMGIRSNKILSFGLGIENLLCALAGAIVVQISGTFSPGMGSGCLIFGMSAIILGEKMLGDSGIKMAIIGTFLGAFVYKVALKLITYRELYGLGDEYTSVILAITFILLISLKTGDELNNSRESM